MSAEHLATGTIVERTSDESGRYFLPSLPVGSYVITTQLVGFRRVSRSGVVVSLGQTLAVDFSLDVGGLTEEIRVTADVPLLQTSNAEISDVIENRVVMQLPLNGRTFLALAQLSDAVVLPPGGTRGEALQQAGPLEDVDARGDASARDSMGSLQRARHGELRSPQSNLRHAEFRTHLQREGLAANAVRRESELLTAF